MMWHGHANPQTKEKLKLLSLGGNTLVQVNGLKSKNAGDIVRLFHTYSIFFYMFWKKLMKWNNLFPTYIY